MSAIPITLFCSLLLAGTFVVLFARDHRRRRFASAERDSLLPLADEHPRAVAPDWWASVSTPTPIADVPLDSLGALSPSNGEIGDHLRPTHEHDHDHHDHDHAHEGGGNCGCRDGSRPPCVGCLRRRVEPASLSS